MVKEKKRKRRRNKEKKVYLPNNVAPILVVPYEHESQTIVEDDFGENTYDLENLFCANL